MTLKPLVFISCTCLFGCSKDDGPEAIHVTCDELNERGVTSRIDNLVSDNKELLNLEGHCLEASFNQKSGDTWWARFQPQTENGEVPNYHLELYFLPVYSDITLAAFQPDDLLSNQCVNVPEGNFCGHIDQNEADPAEDNVDYRILTGFIDLQVSETNETGSIVEGPLEWALGTIDTSSRPFRANGASIILEGSLRLEIDDS